MSPAKRWILWLGLLTGVVGLIVLDDRKAPLDAIVDAVPQRAAHQSSSAASAKQALSEPPMILAIRARSAASKIDDAFPVRDWRPPPPAAAKSAPPPPPSAPAIPYNVLGKKFEDGAWQVFLARGEQILVVKSGDTIDNDYRAEEIRPPIMTLTYLPLQQRQSLNIGGAE